MVAKVTPRKEAVSRVNSTNNNEPNAFTEDIMIIRKTIPFSSIVSMVMILSLVSIFGCIPSKVSPEGDVQYRTISLEDYKDKVAGGWLGQATAVLWGQYTEGIWQGQMIPFEFEDWYRLDPGTSREVYLSIDTAKALETGDWSEYSEKMLEIANNKDRWEIYSPEEMSNQDDLYIEFMFLHSIQKYGLNVTAKQVAEDWVAYLDSNEIWCANKGAYLNFTRDIWPPMSGHPDNTPWGNAIDYQIEADLFGLIAPGLPQSSNAWGDKIGHIMNYGDGVYAGMAMSAMYGEAFFESDPRKLVEHSLKVIPADSEYARMVRFVIDAYDKHPDDWQAAWKELEVEAKASGWIGAVDVRINGAYVYMGLLYGEGDYFKTLNVSMRCGRDSDCNPSSSVGILGTALGLKNTPEEGRHLRDLPINNLGWSKDGEPLNRTMREIYPDYLNWDDILDATVEVGLQNIVDNGGRIEDGMIYIPVQAPTVPALEQVPAESKMPF